MCMLYIYYYVVWRLLKNKKQPYVLELSVSESFLIPQSLGTKRASETEEGVDVSDRRPTVQQG